MLSFAIHLCTRIRYKERKKHLIFTEHNIYLCILLHSRRHNVVINILYHYTYYIISEPDQSNQTMVYIVIILLENSTILQFAMLFCYYKVTYLYDNNNSFYLQILVICVYIKIHE